MPAPWTATGTARPASRSVVVVVIVMSVFLGCARESRQPIRIFAASSLTDVMEVLADSFELVNQEEFDILINVAATSLLARQIDHGARADLFVSAHPAWTDYLRERGKISEVDSLPISNRLVIAARSGDVDVRKSRLAIADPDHVPAGVYARQAFECAGTWDQTSERVIPTLDVRAALSTVEEGAVEAAIVYASDALLAPDLTIKDAVPDSCQPHILYTVAIVRSSTTPGSREMLAYLLDPARAAVWSSYGFDVKR